MFSRLFRQKLVHFKRFASTFASHRFHLPDVGERVDGAPEVRLPLFQISRTRPESPCVFSPAFVNPTVFYRPRGFGPVQPRDFQVSLAIHLYPPETRYAILVCLQNQPVSQQNLSPAALVPTGVVWFDVERFVLDQGQRRSPGSLRCSFVSGPRRPIAQANRSCPGSRSTGHYLQAKMT